MVSVDIGNLVLSLSNAMDLASPSLAQHQQRTGFIVLTLGKLANLSNERMESCFMAALLHDVGALSLEEKIALHNFEVNDTECHCIRGELLLERVPPFREAAKVVRFHHTKWQDWIETIDSSPVLESQLLNLADYVERLIDRDRHILNQNEEIISRIRPLSGSWFHPQLVDILDTAARREEFWLDLVSPRLYSSLLEEGPFSKKKTESVSIKLIAELFRNIIDFRSRYTATHSSGVAAAASRLSKLFGLTETETGLMEVAGNLHDIGKLVIPNSILEKPGKLNKQEFAIMKSHTYFTYSLLNNISGLQQIAGWAAYHHEKLDGSGYPFHLTAEKLDTGARILMIADIFTALAEDRPYRKSLSKKEIIEIIKDDSDRHLLDSNIVSLLFDNFDEISSYVSEHQAISREFYRNQFAFLNKKQTISPNMIAHYRAAH